MKKLSDGADDIIAILKHAQENSAWTDEEIDKAREARSAVIADQVFIEAKNDLTAELPERYRNADLSEWLDNTAPRRTCKLAAMQILFKDEIQLWCGPTRRGKTYLAACLLYRFLKEGKRVKLMDWHYVASLFASHETLDLDNVRRSPTGHIMNLNRFHLLVVDDYNADDMERKPHTLRGLYELIKIREARKLKTVIISNMTEQALRDSFGDFYDMVEARMVGKGALIDFGNCEEWSD
jgi:hypothetical protein